VAVGWREGGFVSGRIDVPRVLVVLSTDRGKSFAAPQLVDTLSAAGPIPRGYRMAAGAFQMDGDIGLACRARANGTTQVHLALSRRFGVGSAVHVASGRIVGGRIEFDTLQAVVPTEGARQVFPSLELARNGTPMVLL
jgi:hypothetical protein